MIRRPTPTTITEADFDALVAADNLVSGRHVPGWRSSPMPPHLDAATAAATPTWTDGGHDWPPAADDYKTIAAGRGSPPTSATAARRRSRCLRQERLKCSVSLQLDGELLRGRQQPGRLHTNWQRANAGCYDQLYPGRIAKVRVGSERIHASGQATLLYGILRVDIEAVATTLFTLTVLDAATRSEVGGCITGPGSSSRNTTVPGANSATSIGTTSYVAFYDQRDRRRLSVAASTRSTSRRWASGNQCRLQHARTSGHQPLCMMFGPWAARYVHQRRARQYGPLRNRSFQDTRKRQATL